MMRFQPYLISVILSLLLFACNSKTSLIEKTRNKPTKVELVQQDDKYQLLLNGEKFWIKGAGLEFGDIDALARNGGNSFRTWRTDNGKSSGKEVLDKAWENGLYVTMGIEVARERHGFDYNDELAVKEQLERIKKEILMYKDHPALIIWAIGNELNLRSTNPKVWNAVNDISKFIHEVDPNHLTTTTTAGISKALVDDIKERAPDIDLLSVQKYADIVNLPRYIEESGWTKAYIVSEWGATGHWEVAKTNWNVPIENNSSEKADYYLERYYKAIHPYKDQCVGSYVFLWGQKQERTPTWYGLFLASGEETEAIDVMHFIWNGEWPENRAPRFESFTLNGKTSYDNIVLSAEQEYEAHVSIVDPEKGKLRFIWDVKKESTDLGDGGDYESVPPSIPNVVQGTGNKIELKAPAKPGAYRLFVYALDDKKKAAHGNIPFFVK